MLQNSIIVKDINDFKKFHSNISAFVETNVDKIIFKIDLNNAIFFRQTITNFVDAQFYRSMDLKGNYKDSPLFFTNDFKFFLKALPTMKKNSNRLLCSYFMDDELLTEDDKIYAGFVIIKGDKYGN